MKRVKLIPTKPTRSKEEYNICLKTCKKCLKTNNELIDKMPCYGGIVNVEGKDVLVAHKGAYMIIFNENCCPEHLHRSNEKPFITTTEILSKYSNNYNYDELPDIDDLKKYNKVYTCAIDDVQHKFNADYLIEIKQIIGDNGKFYVNENLRDVSKYESEYGIAYIMPMIKL